MSIENPTADMDFEAARAPEDAARTNAQFVERRRSPRVTLETEITIESESNFYTGFTEDISDGGLFLATYQLRPIGSEIEVSFTLPDGHTVHASGLVRWLRDPRDYNRDAPPGMGIQFHGLSDQDRAAILEFIRSRSPLFYDE